MEFSYLLADQAKKDGGATLNVLLTAKIITSWAKSGDEKYLHQFLLIVSLCVLEKKSVSCIKGLR